MKFVPFPYTFEFTNDVRKIKKKRKLYVDMNKVFYRKCKMEFQIAYKKPGNIASIPKSMAVEEGEEGFY